MKTSLRAALALATALAATPAFAAASFFSAGNLVVAVEGTGDITGKTAAYADNQAAPLTLFQYSVSTTKSASYVNSLVLPQSGAGAISGEYGSSSEGMLQLSGDGKSLVIAGYGTNAATWNALAKANAGTTKVTVDGSTALGQSTSLSSNKNAVARVIAVIGKDGAVDTSTRLFNVYDGNNPRSVATTDGKTFYISGQGSDPDHTAGVYYTTLGSSSATAITGDDTTGKKPLKGLPVSQDTRDVQIVNGQLYVSADSKGGTDHNRDYIGTLGTQGNLPTTLANGGNGPAQLTGFGNSGGTGKFITTAATANGITAIGTEVNLSPEQFFFANSTTLYVADSGAPKNDSATNDGGSTLGLGGLQKWSLIDGSWTLDYTLYQGLNLRVAGADGSYTTGLFGLTGQVVDGQVYLYATTYSSTDLGQTYLYGITDDLALISATGPVNESFTQLAAAPTGSNFKGVSFAPTPEPATWATMVGGFGLIGGSLRRRGKVRAAA